MNKKAKKAYDKAMDLYEKGKINKALEICEESLLEGLDNPVVLNFKGLLLYQKGDLNEATIVWKMNKELNNDDIAKNYIKDAMADEKRLEMYRQGEQALKRLNIDKALELFNRCIESDFNTIKVNTGLAMCYQKKGDFYKAKEYVDKALSIDRNAITANIIEKELQENGVYEKSKNSSKGLLIGITILFVTVAIIVGGYLIISKLKNKNLVNNIEGVKNDEIIDESTTKTQDEVPELQENKEINSETDFGEKGKEESESTKFDKEKIKPLIASNDLNGVYEQLRNIKEESISSEDIDVYKQAINLMKDQGVSKFYEYGLWYFNQSRYLEAGVSLDKAYTYCDGNSLKEHILFYRASNSLKELDEKTALKEYEEYYIEYPNGVYVQEALYELASLNNSVDKSKSKTYANTLINNFPESIYVNDNLLSISKG